MTDWDLEPGPASEAEIKAVEAEIGVSLPTEYRQFLATRKNFRGDKSIYVPAFDMWEHVTYLYWPSADVENQLGLTIYRSYVPDGYLQIGADGFGNYFCICIKGPDRGQVVCIDFSYLDGDPDDGVSVDDNGVQVLAKNFQQFLDALEVLPDED